MRNKLYWGLGILIVLLIGAFVFVMVNEYTEIRQQKKDMAEAVKQAETRDKSINNMPPAKLGFKWVRHGDHYHQVKITEQIETTDPKIAESDKADNVSWLNMSPEQLKVVFSKLSYAEKEFLDLLELSPEECVQRFLKMDDATKLLFYNTYREERKRLAAYRKEWGENPPPIGANWQHMRNHNGETLRHYDNSVTIFYRDGIGFAPTLKQWERHEELETALAEAQRRGDTAEWNRISAQLETLIASAQGPVPIINGGLYSGNPISDEEKNKKILEAEREIYRKFGIEHTLQQLSDPTIPILIK